MIDEETMIDGTEDYTPDPEPAPPPEPEPAPEAALEPAPVPEPEEPVAPVEVITIEDLLNRLTGAGQDETEEPPQETEGEDLSEVPEAPASEALFNNGEPIQVIGMDTALKRLETIQQTVDHPALTTSFEDYTVTEALLLLLFLSAFVAACVKMLKGGFAWLR